MLTTFGSDNPLDSSSCFRSHLSLCLLAAYSLADEGYDVWLLNVRGNQYALNHTTLSSKDSKFWDFS